ncbi:hypothetical protein NP493_260g03043 [Ridgeia piscesae]|uniref:Serpin domain-containing protein n=1 Tax=Ridgeia piscesae TaxID=27915 RepID=A0AAD9NY31_RIDPI|nr:hypothetical protein NP493_260g03043 [Ridgeia piscesae]
MVSAILLGVILVGLSQPGLSLTPMEEVVAANSDFAMDLYAQIKTDPKFADKNIFFSPFSVSAALAMVYAGAKGNTRTEMGEVLKFDNVNDNNVHIGFRKLFEGFNDPTNNYTLSVANALFGRKAYPFLQTYLNIVTQYYYALLKNLDFGANPGASRKFINDWVANNTNQKIKNLLIPLDVTQETVAVLVNTIYFNGLWKLQFDVNDTISSEFHLTTTKSMTTKIMNLAGKKLKYAEISSLSCKILELPYVGDEVSMYILLPDSINGLPALESQLTSAKLNNAISLMQTAKVDVSIPKFNMTQRINLKDTLKAMGMIDLFWTSADLSGIDGTHDLFVTKAIHQAYIDVNEEGTEAGAATAVLIGRQQPKMFKADHPFLFFIRENVTGSILFSGRVMTPPEAAAESVNTGCQETPPCLRCLPDWLCQLILRYLSRYWCYSAM